MANENKSLIIDGPAIACSKADIWDKVDFAKDSFLEKIKTGATVSGKDLSINSYVSGVPSPYARVHLLKYALSHSRTIRQNPDAGINKFYKGLLDQWRVLITGMALHSPLFEVKRVYLTYSDGKDIQDTSNPYEAKGAFGNMLLHSKDRWCDPTLAEDKKVPFIDVLKYSSGTEKRVVGGLCAETIVFTSTRFDAISQPDLFEEAMHLSDKDKGRLLAYIKHIKDELPAYGSLMNTDTMNIGRELDDWADELKVGLSEDVNTEDIPNVSKFQHPFNKLLNHTSNFFSNGNGAIFKTMPEDSGDYVDFDLNEILLPKDADIAKIRVTPEASKNPSCMQNFPLYLLKAERIGEAGSYDYFALPLTAKGLQVYGTGVAGLLSENGGEIRSSLKATYDPNKTKDNLTVTLEVRFSGDNSEKGAEKQEVYTVNKTMIDRKDIVLWPNFVRDKWNRYYIYSELPHNTQSSDCPFNAVPIAGIPSQGRINMMVDSEKNPVLLAKNGLANSEIDNFRPKLLVTATKVLDKPYKYEIYQSNMPYYGLSLSSKGKASGYLVVKYGREGQKQLPRNLWGQAFSDVKEASVGFDFGSTNTSVAFKIGNENPEGFTFENRRISLLMNTHSPETDKSGWHESKTETRNLFFFQRNRVQSNAIKSILSLHDPMRIDLETGEPTDIILENAIVGGFPCLEKELPIESVNPRRINLAFDSDTTAELVHNMKWSENKLDEANRKAFLRSLLLQVYAELYDPIDNNRVSAVVNMIRWSYPSSFNYALSNQYSAMWKSVIKDFPFEDENHGGYKYPEISVPKFDDGGLGNGLGGSISSDTNGGMTGGLGGGLQGGLGGGLQGGLGGGLQGGLGGGLGSQSAPVGGLGSAPVQAKQEVVDLRPKNEPIDFNFVELSLGSSSLTEAVAVANNYASKIDMNRLLLCFDIGGSTSDFSAMCSVRNNPALVKQSSIKFAAQNVVKATQFCANKFKDIALEICKENDWHIPGLNVGENRFNADSAMFYFDQIADRLDVDKLPGFYNKIGTACQPLMITNLYVTGLIMFYAGQITRRLVQNIRNANGEDANPTFRPQIMLKCAGKGARVFEWLSCINKDLATNYFRYTYLAGIAGTIENENVLNQNAGQFIYDVYVDELVKGEASADIKYEVSMGLIRQSSQKLLVPKMDNAIECVGEDNFITTVSTTKEQAALKFDDCVTSDMYRYLGAYFTCPLRGNYQQFNNFINLFYSYARNFGVESYFQGPEVIQYLKNFDMSEYVRSLPEYQKAQSDFANGKSEKFDFVQPFIILEGMNFMENFLFKHLK